MYDHKDGISLRKVHTGDLHPLLALKQESWWGTHSTLIVNVEDQKAWYDGLGNDSLYMMAEQKPRELKVGANGKKSVKSMVQTQVVGVACYTEIDWYSRCLNISGSIIKEHRQMDEVVKPAFSAGLDFAFEILNMHRVGAEVLETHSAAQRLEIGHLGFTIEGRRRKAVYKAGRYYDSIQLGILREEWEQSGRVTAYAGCCNDNFDHDLADKAIERFNRGWGEVVGSQ